jgi:hypothetical protein
MFPRSPLGWLRTVPMGLYLYRRIASGGVVKDRFTSFLTPWLSERR